VADSTFSTPDLTTFARLDTLGLQVTGQFLEPDRAVLACRIIDRDATCGRCGSRVDCGTPRRGGWRTNRCRWRPTILLVTVSRYRCAGCGHVWRQDTSSAAEPRARLSRSRLRWALTALVCQHLTVARIAEGLGVSWNTGGRRGAGRRSPGVDRRPAPVRARATKRVVGKLNMRCDKTESIPVSSSSM